MHIMNNKIWDNWIEMVLFNRVNIVEQKVLDYKTKHNTS